MVGSGSRDPCRRVLRRFIGKHLRHGRCDKIKLWDMHGGSSNRDGQPKTGRRHGGLQHAQTEGRRPQPTAFYGFQEASPFAGHRKDGVVTLSTRCSCKPQIFQTSNCSVLERATCCPWRVHFPARFSSASTPPQHRAFTRLRKKKKKIEASHFYTHTHIARTRNQPGLA